MVCIVTFLSPLYIVIPPYMAERLLILSPACSVCAAFVCVYVFVHQRRTSLDDDPHS
jgi:hypothetical protein